jgi:hypothetical protein
MAASCCEDPVHAPNRKEEVFMIATLSGLERLKKAMRDFFINKVMNFRFVSPL